MKWELTVYRISHRLGKPTALITYCMLITKGLTVSISHNSGLAFLYLSYRWALELPFRVLCCFVFVFAVHFVWYPLLQTPAAAAAADGRCSIVFELAATTYMDL